MLSAQSTRQKFLDFFESKGHKIVPSAPMVIKNDPTLLFTNAGMNQFKDFFMGDAVPKYRRVADTQKCLRVSGKHNDLEEVGVDTYHHTMFEMLGNWSFGDYFKKEAIAWSWELLTTVYGLDKDTLYVTIFEGDEEEGLPQDEEAEQEWKKWVAPDRILKGNKKDNFWEMGDTGPCGPCTEIHVDCRSEADRQEIKGADLVNKDHPQVLEIWNNVFMQYNRNKNGSLTPLPEKHVDTGMGFERLVRVLQKKSSNYDTDIFSGLIDKIATITGKNYQPQATPLMEKEWKEAVAFRVLADHIRAIAFAIADGQLPANVGAGYVIRRILRRAIRYYYSALQYRQPLLFQLTRVVANDFAQVFPELKKQEEFVARVIKEEEEAFLRTLEKGLKRMDDMMRNNPGSTLDGKSVFELYDTYGFPLDLTLLIASENKMQIDEKGFEEHMAQQKNRSRAATLLDKADWQIVQEETHREFVGYDQTEIDTRILRYRQVQAKGKSHYELVLEKTPFYAESGGQIGDTGRLVSGTESINILDTKKENDLIIHVVSQLPGQIEGKVHAEVDLERRKKIANNHTATHLLHAALRQVLGNHVAQKGSLVSHDILRFDVSHFAKISEEELATIQNIVNEKIRANLPVNIREMSKDEAIHLGAMALFGEKYGEIVRVVTIDDAQSIELCGGTHVKLTGNIGAFVIVAESAVAAGVRRLEVLTGNAAMQYLESKAAQMKQIGELLKSKEPFKSVEKLIEAKQELERKFEAVALKELNQIKSDLANRVQQQSGFLFLGEEVKVQQSDHLRKLTTDLKKEIPGAVIALVAILNGKINIALSVDEVLSKQKGWDAQQIIKSKIAPLIKGGGGGNATLATAGGADVTQSENVIKAILHYLCD